MAASRNRNRIESASRAEKMQRLLNRSTIALGLLLVLAGCSSAPNREASGGGPPPVWNAANDSRPTEPRFASLPFPIRGAKPAPSQSANTSRPARAYSKTWISLDRWSRDSRQGPVREIQDSTASNFQSATSNGVLVVRSGTLVATWGGVEFRLGFLAPARQGIPAITRSRPAKEYRTDSSWARRFRKGRIVSW